jgi:uncharacterized protein with PIN domain
MVIDTSAVVALLFGEAEAEVFAEAIEADAVRLMSVASTLEATIVIEASSARKVAAIWTRCSRPSGSRSSRSPPNGSRRLGTHFTASAKAAIPRP